ncbi:MAG: RES family NAD+ phosphorylase [Ginsengibacter sp.]
MLVYRIVHKKFSGSLFASGMEGRWNAEGNKVLYCAESIALAFLENMIRRQGVGFNDDFKIMVIEIPDRTKVTLLNADDLKPAWREHNNYSECQAYGNKWYCENKTLLLKVPSAVLPQCFNFVINTTHPGYKTIKLVGVSDLIPDEKIEEILKKYSK